MASRMLTLLLIFSCWSPTSIADHVKYEFGSYRDKLSLSYSSDSLELLRFSGGEKKSICVKAISKDMLAHSAIVFDELSLVSWASNYFIEDKVDGVVFSLDIQIKDFKKLSVGHIELAPKEHAKLVRYFNQVLVVNGCEEAI